MSAVAKIIILTDIKKIIFRFINHPFVNNDAIFVRIELMKSMCRDYSKILRKPKCFINPWSPSSFPDYNYYYYVWNAIIGIHLLMNPAKWLLYEILHIYKPARAVGTWMKSLPRSTKVSPWDWCFYFSYRWQGAVWYDVCT